MCSVYAIVPSTHSGPLPCAGFDGHEEIRTIAYNDVAAIIGQRDLLDLTTMSKEELLRALMDHQKIVETVMAHFDVLPVKFGTFLLQEQVLTLLKHGYKTFQSFLMKFSNKVQMELVVTWDINTVISTIAAEPDVATLVAEAKALKPQPDTQAGIIIGQLVESKLSKRKATLAEEIESAVGTICLKKHSNPILSDQIIVNLGLLLESKETEILERTVNELDERFNQQLTFKIIGPLPPYSFATVRVEKPDFETINHARKRMGLSVSASLQEIDARYRAIARIVHPDQAAGNAAAFRQLTADYRLLRDCWTTLIGNDNTDTKCRFSRTLCSTPVFSIGKPEEPNA